MNHIVEHLAAFCYSDVSLEILVLSVFKVFHFLPCLFCCTLFFFNCLQVILCFLQMFGTCYYAAFFLFCSLLSNNNPVASSLLSLFNLI